MKSVDVVVPCYNYGRYLEYCVGSILAQRDVNVRVLIIDDTSSDNSAEIGQAIAARDSRVTFRRHAVNQRHIKTFNEGIIDWAEAQYLALVSADDALTPGALARAVEVMEQHDDVNLVFGAAKVMHGEDCPAQTDDVPSLTYRVISGERFLQRCCTKEGNPVASPAVVVRTAMQHQLGGYEPTLPHTCDMEMWMRFATRGPIGVIREPQALYRVHRANMTHGEIKSPVSDLPIRFATCAHIYERWDGKALPGYVQAYHEMRKTMAQIAMHFAILTYDVDHPIAVRANLDFAAKVDPAIVISPRWLRRYAKTLPGIRQAFLWFRDKAGIATSVRDATGPSTTMLDTSFSWWPEEA